MKHTSALLGIATFGFALLPSCTKQPYEPMVVSIQAPRREFLDGYLNWIHEHQKGDFDVVIPTPYIDLYDSSGRSVCYENHPERVPALLHLLLNPAASPVDVRPAKRPSLAEAMNMFSELKPYERRVPGRTRYTVFALSNPDKPDRAEASKQQDEAVAELKKHASDLKIRVIEVRIHR